VRQKNCQQTGRCVHGSIDPLSRARRKFFGPRDKSDTVYSEILDNTIHDEVYDLDNKYLSGYWQNAKYFCDIKDVIVKGFTFKIPQNEMA
jgi:hypothetical protein